MAHKGRRARGEVRRGKSDTRALVIAFLQDSQSLPPIVRALGKGKLFRSATVQVSPDREPVVGSWIASRRLELVLVVICGVLAAVAGRLAFTTLASPEVWIHAVLAVTAALVGGWAIARLVDIASAKAIVFRQRKWVIKGEAMVVVSTRSGRAGEAADIMSQAGGEHPAVFVLHPPSPGMVDPVTRSQPALGEDAIHFRTVKLASDLKHVTRRGPKRGSLVPRLNECEETLRRVQGRLASAVQLEEGIALSAEWLLDNAYIVQGHIEDFRRNLPASFYHELPCLIGGPRVGLPRVYSIAAEMVADWDGRLTRDGIESFLQTFQSETTLTTGELWALPMMLRLRLIEYLASLCLEVERRQSESELAGFWANRLLYTARREPDRMPAVMAAVASDCPRPSPHVVEELLSHLYDEEAALSPVRGWLQAKFPAPLEDVVRQDEQIEAADQASLANAISTLRLLAQLDWRKVFEAVSRVEATLWADPAQVYGQMDFATRDHYRHVVEGLSRRKPIEQEEIATAAIDLARSAVDEPMRHVGYYLVDDGLPMLEGRLGIRPPIRLELRRWAKRNAALVYMSGITLATGLLVLSAVRYSALLPGHLWTLVGLAGLFLLPASDLAVQLVNYLITRTLKPYPLPKMAFDDGIPDGARTLVVVPMLLLTPESIREEVERLEIRALANSDPNLRYALLSDYSDAPQKDMPEDLELLDVAVRGIDDLNKRHPATSFLLFYRDRKWSDDERRWMGWERKRGKLEQLNRLLVGEPGADGEVLIAAGAREAIEGIAFVITLDSDTQLPRDTAHRMVATLAHPLNRPHLATDGRSLARGYTIIQPRVSTSLPSATSTVFTWMFTDPTGIDPYTHAVPDVYQDLAGSGSYHGKGIYDVRAFHSILTGRFPEAQLLSHDLLEGAYARVGLASDIELLDGFPPNYGAYSARLHRWIRGDWQILAWLLPRVPAVDGTKQPNPLPALERWKIFDNLRRSLMPDAVVAMIVLGCALSPTPGLCSLLAAGFVLSSTLLPLLTRLTQRWKVDPMVWREPAENLARSFLTGAALPHQAWLSLNAIGQAIYRQTVSHRKLLEWNTSGEAAARSRRSPAWLFRMVLAPLFSGAAFAIVYHAHPRGATGDILPWALLWAGAPVLLSKLDMPLGTRAARQLTANDRLALRQLGRQTWRFFDEFVGPETHWLPPDNYQEMLRVELAERTSPTNIGLYLISVLAAHDLGYISPDQAIDRVLATMKTLHEMERYRGHLLNWYDTSTLAPLGDRYVSTVDSGNLMGCLWALDPGLVELTDGPLIGPHLFRGLSDTLELLAESKPPTTATPAIAAIRHALAAPPSQLEHIADRLRGLAGLAENLLKATHTDDPLSAPAGYWACQLQSQISSWKSVVDRYASWVEVLASPPENSILGLGQRAHGLRRQALSEIPSLRSLVDGSYEGLFDLLALPLPSEDPSHELTAWVDRLSREVEQCREAARGLVRRTEDALSLIRQLDVEMEMGFLFDPHRQIFAIGYNVNDQRLDGSYYDLLASEARLASFVAIARGDVDTEHWWALGRPFGFAYLRRPLLSWSGTMFEYLMPLLLNKSHANSMLDQACRTAVECQQIYARRRGIPWGISESAYSALDGRQVYQYQAFGVPALALKRGLDEDFVVAPYASALALSIDPKAAAHNLAKSGPLARAGLRGNYGFYESIDFTRQRGPHGERGVVVYTYMAHHQGMTLVAICNALEGDVMPRRFHSDPRVLATESLLFERVPVAPPFIKTYPRENPIVRLAPISAIPAPGRVETPDTATPRTCLLANGAYRLMITNAGGGYSRWGDFDITRWRADTTTDDSGKFCYLKDLDSGFVWSATHQPVCTPANSFHVTFAADQAEFRRRDRGIETITEIVVSPEDNAEIWRLSLINRSPNVRRIEVTSYSELALAPHAADRSHPAFNKLFIETAILRDLDALLAWRRLKSADEAPIWVAHVLSSATRSHEPTPFETDRGRFIGRGRTLRNPIALESRLSGSEGYVLDPIFSIRRSFTIAPGERVQLAFVTVAAASRDQAVALATKYRDPESASRAFHLAWTNAQLELRHLRIKPGDAQLYQQLASHILYPHAHLRAPPERLAKNRLGQPGLWALGISGDLPIMVLTIAEAQHLELVQEILSAHAFWRVRGLMCDLVILNEEAASYDQPLQVELQRLVAARSLYTGVDQPGGVFLRPAKQIGQDDLTLLLAAAHVVLVAARGTLSQQIGLPSRAGQKPVRKERAPAPEEPSPPLPFMELDYFNGLGGFTPGGREYSVYLERGTATPRPWSNVMANPNFGALVTDEGPGFTWYGNSQSNKLTAWSNDPICNTAGDAIYLYDPDLNALWSATPLPIREEDPYRTRHGQGYTVCEHNSHAIDQELTTFVPVDEGGGAPVRIQRLKLTNRSSRRRSLSITFYAGWVLGADREQSQLNIVTNWDLETQSLFARNAFSPAYSATVAFAACTPAPRSFTADRTEVLGRNGSLRAPEGLNSARPLGERSGGGLDPCAALRVQLDLEPGETGQVTFLLGAAQVASEARSIVRRFRQEGEADRALLATTEFWEDLLAAVRIETPDPSVDLMVNRWLPYQVLSGRFWGRSGFYQSGGAYGFRDQLQDVLALVYSQPHLTREHILRSAARQFPEGDVQHWWHPDTGAGVRTRISDDLLWLPFVTAHYVEVTGDRAILDEQVPFIVGRLLDKGERDAYFVPETSSETAPLLEHCRRAVEKGTTSGPHGLPTIGGGDWNDGLDLVGIGGKGESVWLAWFLVEVLGSFAGLVDPASAGKYRQRAKDLVERIEATAWDGEWYRRAYFDDGTPLGSKDSPEARIDSLPQSWAAISGTGAPDRAHTAMRSVDSQLVRAEDQMVLLFTPPFDTSPLQPGYIKGYPPGVRENGGQYTHGSLWTAMGWARLGDGDQAVRLLRMMNPVSHATTAEAAHRYLVEPYVAAADVYALPGRVGMGGWTWYTGSAAWMYRIWLEEVLGFKLRGDRLTIDPVVPKDWTSFKMQYRHGRTPYSISVENGQGVNRGVTSVELDGVVLEGKVVELADDRIEHQVRVVMG